MPQTVQAFEHTDSHSPTNTNCCGCTRIPRRVAPVKGTYPGYEIIEIRPSRVIRVRHLNPTPRDPALEKLMQERHERKKSGRLKSIHHRIQRHKTKQHIDLKHKQQSSRPQSQTHPSPTDESSHSTQANGKLSCGSDTDENSNANNKESLDPENSHHLHDKNLSPNHTTTSHGIQPPLRSRTTTASSVNIELPDKQTYPSTVNSQTPYDNLKSLPPAGSSKKAHTPQKTKTSEVSHMEDNNTALFLIHGVGGSSDVWQAQMDFFGQEGYEMIVPDLLGHGFSGTPKDPKAYDFSEISEDLLQLFDKYCKMRNVVIGHSYGCSFAAVLGRRRARHVSKLVLISGGSPTPLAPQPGIFQAPLCCLTCCRPLMTRGFSKSAFHKQNKTYISREKAFDIPTHVLKAVMNGQNWEEGDAEYHEWINAPTLLIHGRQDLLVSIEEEQEMEQAIYDCKLVVIDEASHMVMLEKPQEVNKLIHDFLLSNMRLLGSASKQKKGDKSGGQPVTIATEPSSDMPEDVKHSSLSLRSVKSLPSGSDLITSNLR